MIRHASSATIVQVNNGPKEYLALCGDNIGPWSPHVHPYSAIPGTDTFERITCQPCRDRLIAEYPLSTGPDDAIHVPYRDGAGIDRTGTRHLYGACGFDLGALPDARQYPHYTPGTASFALVTCGPCRAVVDPGNRPVDPALWDCVRDAGTSPYNRCQTCRTFLPLIPAEPGDGTRMINGRMVYTGEKRTPYPAQCAKCSARTERRWVAYVRRARWERAHAASTPVLTAEAAKLEQWLTSGHRVEFATEVLRMVRTELSRRPTQAFLISE